MLPNRRFAKSKGSESVLKQVSKKRSKVMEQQQRNGAKEVEAAKQQGGQQQQDGGAPVVTEKGKAAQTPTIRHPFLTCWHAHHNTATRFGTSRLYCRTVSLSVLI